MSTKYPGGFISSTEPTVSPLSAKGIWTLAEALRYKTAGEWPVAPIYVAVQGVFATANVGQAEAIIPVLLTGLQATGNVNDITVIASAIVALDTVSGTGGVGQVSITLPTSFDPYFNLNSMLLADSLANTFITDEGPNKFVITPNGDTRPSAFSPYNGGWSNYFDGNGDYIQGSDDVAFDFGTGDFTIECWFMRTVTPTSAYHGIVGANGSGFNGWSLYYTNGNEITMFGDAGSLRTTSGANITNNVWYHVAVVKVSGVLKIFVNGVEKYSAADTTAYNCTANGWRIGDDANHANGWMNGYISNLRIVKDTAVYTSDFTPPTSPLTSISGTSLLTCQSNRFVENSANNFTLTRNGDTKAVSFGPFSTDYRSTPDSYSVAFDGSGDYLVTNDNSAYSLGTGDFTVEAWLYNKGYAGSQYGRGWCAIYPAASYGSNRLMLRLWNGSNQLNMYLAIGGSAYFGTSGTNSTALITPYSWTHVAFVRQSGTFKLYINGTLDTTISNVTVALNFDQIDIGRTQDGGVPDWNGSISNTRIVKGTAVYTANFVPSTAPLTAITNTSLLTCQSSTVIDNSSNGFAITTNGEAQPVTANPFDGSPITYSGYFDGTGDNVEIASNSAFDVGTGDFTMEFWVYPLAYSATYIFRGSSNSSWGGIQWYLSTDSSGNMVLAGSNGGGASNYWAGGTTPLATWTHVAIVRDSNAANTWRVFVNGTSINYAVGAGASNSMEVNTTSQPLHIGGFPGWSQTTGYISNFRFVKGTPVYTSDFTPSTTPLTDISGTSLLTCQSPKFIDNSSNAFAITVNGDAVVKPNNPFGYNEITQTAITDTTGSGYFDGSGDSLQAPSGASISGTGDFTTEFWIFPPSFASSYKVLSANDTASGLAIGLNANGTIFYGRALVSIQGTTTTSVTFNAWNHIAVVRSSGTLKIFINGTEGYSAAQTYSYVSGVVRIGTDGGGSSFPYIGYISNYRNVLGTAVYTSNFLPPATPVTSVTNTSLLTLQHRVSYNNSQPIDTSGIKNIVTRNGNAAVGSFSPYVPSGWSGYFDGSASIRVDNTSNFTGPGTGAFTVEGFFYPTGSTSSDQTIYYYYRTNLDIIRAYLNGSTKKLIAGYRATSLSFGTLTSSGTYDDNAWNHFAITRDGTSLSLYLNGSLAASTTISASASWQDTTFQDSPRIGSATNPVTNYFNGYISNLRQIHGTAIDYSTVPVPTEPLPWVEGTELLTLRDSSFIDDSGGIYSLTLANGTPKITPSSPFSPNTVTPDSYSYFHSANADYLSVADDTNLQFETGEFTIEAWIYQNATSGTNTICTKGSSGGSGWLFRVASNALQMLVSGFGTNVYSLSSITPYTWHHVVVMRDSSNNLIMGIDGVLETVKANVTYNMNQINPLYIGTSRAPGTNSFPGYISNLRMVKGVAVYTGNFTPPSGPLAATQSSGTNIAAITGTSTSLLTSQSRDVVDNSTNEFAITVNGTVQPTNFNPFGETVTSNVTYTPASYGGSIYFDGSDRVTVPNVMSGAGNCTMECWVYPMSSTAAIMGTLEANDWMLWINNWTLLLLCRQSFNVGNLTLKPYSWNYIRVERYQVVSGVSGGVRFTVNDQYYDTGSSLSSGSLLFLTSEANMSIGAMNNDGRPFTGYISNVRLSQTNVYPSGSVAAPYTPLTKRADSLLLTCGNNAAIYDYTGKNDLETVGNARTVQETPYRDNHSVYFDGTGDEIETASAIVSSTEYSIEAWVYATLNQQGYIAAQYTAGNGSRTVFLYRESNTNLYFYHPNVGSVGAIPLALSTWYHVVITRDSGGRTRMFVDGVLKHTFTTSYTPEASSFSIGGNGEAGSNFGGYISNMRVLNGGIPPSYQTASTTIDAVIFTPPTSPLTDITNTVLLTCNTYNFTDSSSTPLTLTVSGNTSISSRGPFQQNEGDRSLYFDGTGDYLVIKDNPVLAFGSGDFTLEMWLYSVGGDAGNVYDGRPNSSTNGAYPSLLIYASTLRWYISSGDRITSSTIPVNQWFHVVVQRSSGTTKMFIDGTQTGSDYTDATSYLGPGTGAVHIASDGNTSAAICYIDDLRITRGVARYNVAGFDPPSEPLPKV